MRRIKICSHCETIEINESTEMECFECGAESRYYDCSNISDGHHTFKELYEHRYMLFLSLVNYLSEYCFVVQDHYQGYDLIVMTVKDLVNSIGSDFQVSYHVPTRLRGLYLNIKIIDKEEYKFDGHTNIDVLKRLELLIKMIVIAKVLKD